MVGIALVWFSAVMFVHMGLGEAICRTFRIRFILFLCPKCMSFWAVLGYSLLIVKFPIEVSVAVAFLLSYGAIWFDLLLGKLAEIYESMESKKKEEHGE
jgi:hypothetical protein